MGDKVCYTAIFGSYDDLKDPQVITSGWEYICYTDQDLKSSVWEIIKVPQLERGAQRTARYYKLMYHNHITANQSIWVDASFIVNCNLDSFWLRNFKASFSASKHPMRDCVYLEAQACIKNGRDKIETISSQILSYKEQGIKEHNGMIASGILLREQSGYVFNFCQQWYEELERGSVRDQIAWAKIDQQNPGVCKKFDFNYVYSDEMIFTTHLHKRAKYGKVYRPKRRRVYLTGNKIV